MATFISRLFGPNKSVQISQEPSFNPNEHDVYDEVADEDGFLVIECSENKRTEKDRPISELPGPIFDRERVECSLQQSPQVFNPTPKPSSPISDVPFKFNPILDAQLYIKDIFSGINLETSQFNWGKYSHDFTNEKLCLRDLRCGEEADIDDFLTSHFPTTPSSNRNENLINL